MTPVPKPNIGDTKKQKRLEHNSIPWKSNKKIYDTHKIASSAVSTSALHEEGSRMWIIKDLVELLYTDISEETLIKTLKFLRRQIFPPVKAAVDELIAEGFLPRIVSYLTCESHEVQFEAAWALANICAGTTAHVTSVVEAGAVAALVNVLATTSLEKLGEQVVCALGNIAGDSPCFRDYVLDHGAIRWILNSTENTKTLTLLQMNVWALLNLVSGGPDFFKIRDVVPVLRSFLIHTDPTLVAESCWALAYISESPPGIQSLIDNNVPMYVVCLLEQDEEVMRAALQVIGNLTSGEVQQAQKMLDCKFLHHLWKCLQSTDESILNQSCWIVSNITAGSEEQIKEVLHNHVLPLMIHRMRTCSLETKIEICWSLKNLCCCGSWAQVESLVGQGVVPVLCSLLGFTQEVELLDLALDTLHRLLYLGESFAKRKNRINHVADEVEICNGLGAVESLLSHSKRTVYRKAYNIMEKFFSFQEKWIQSDYSTNHANRPNSECVVEPSCE